MLLFFRVGEKNEPDRFMAVTSGDFIFSKKSQTLTFQTMIISVIKLVRGFLPNSIPRYEHHSVFFLLLGLGRKNTPKKFSPLRGEKDL